MATNSGKRNRKKNDVIEHDEDSLNKIAKDSIRSYFDKDIKVKAKNESQLKLINSIQDKEITICKGFAGSGKTFLALVWAINLLRKENNKYQTIHLVKSVTPLKGEEIGFLKGDLIDKIEPFMASYMLNLEKMTKYSYDDLKRIVEHGIVRLLPLAYIRGVSIDNSIIIVDEAQNIPLDNMRTIMTRIGENSKLIIIGDTNQIDLRYKNESSLESIFKMFENVDEIGCIQMSDEDVNARNPLINKIEKKFKEHYESRKG